VSYRKHIYAEAILHSFRTARLFSILMLAIAFFMCSLFVVHINSVLVQIGSFRHKLCLSFFASWLILEQARVL
jgi:hypothetical protein